MKRMAILGCIGATLLTGAVYGSAVIKNDFVEWDDGLLITNNEATHGLTWTNVKKAFTSYDPELYIPLTILSYQVDYEIWGMNPVGFHLTNLMLHIGNALLVVWFVWFFMCHGERVIPSVVEGRTMAHKGVSHFDGACPEHSRRAQCDTIKYIPWFCGLLFVIHPLNTEAVMWASARKDLLMGFFFLLSLNCYLHSCHPEPVEGRAQRSLDTNASKWYYASILAFVLACLSKVTAVMLPFILLLIYWYKEHPPLTCPSKPWRSGTGRGRGGFKEIFLYFPISILFILIALLGKAGSHGLWWEKVLIGAKATIFYLQKLFWPTGFSVLYPYTEKISISNPDLWVPVGLVIFITTLSLVLSLKREREIYKNFAFGWFFFLLLLAPSFTNFAKGQDILKDVYFASDRYAYLASIGIIYIFVFFLHYAPRYIPRVISSRVMLSVVEAWHPLCRISTTLNVTLSVVLFVFSFLSYYQSFVWNTTESLFTNVVQYYPNAHVAQNNLGSLYYRRGEIDRAIQKYKESLAVRPNATAFFNLGVIYMDNGYPAIAREAFTQALQLNSADTEAKERLSLLGM